MHGYGFESNVNSDSIQTFYSPIILTLSFESNVNSDSIQTFINTSIL